MPFAKILGITYGFLSLIFLLFMSISFLMPSSNKKPAVFVMLFIAVVYPILGFVFGFIMACIYNFSAGLIGGIEIEVEDKN